MAFESRLMLFMPTVVSPGTAHTRAFCFSWWACIPWVWSERRLSVLLESEVVVSCSKPEPSWQEYSKPKRSVYP
jgi:hypothetical protein